MFSVAGRHHKGIRRPTACTGFITKFINITRRRQVMRLTVLSRRQLLAAGLVLAAPALALAQDYPI
jgi:hypothetical protein